MGRQSPLSIDGESGGLLPFNIDGDGGLLRNSCRPGNEEERWGLEKKKKTSPGEEGVGGGIRLAEEETSRML